MKHLIDIMQLTTEEIDEMIMLIRDSFLPAFTDLEQILKEKLNEAESIWQ